VTVVSATLANKLWPNADPIGKQIRVGGLTEGPIATIIGVVEDLRYQEIDDTELRPMLYFPAKGGSGRSMMIVARGSAGAMTPVRSLIASLDRRLPAPTVVSMSELVGRIFAARRFALVLFGVFAGTAVLLAVIGLYGVLSYLVKQRAAELGIRIALGASSRSIVRLIVVGALKLTVLGVVIGLVASQMLTKWLGSLLFGVSPTDTLTFTSLSLLLVGVAVAASLLPAWRATRADPVSALRGEA
jgi:ABC-type antimicrobial peptide transport system permease subunit